MPMNSAVQLIGIDWGSTCLRIFLISSSGEVLATRSNGRGISSINGSANDYEQSLKELAGDWLEEYPAIQILACGMVGSKHGWLEVPYVICAAGDVAIASGIRTVSDGQKRQVHIVPGLAFMPANVPPDVMRGEETQIIGALTLRPDCHKKSCLILPGTHSKWVHIEHGKVLSLSTHMTGELFAVLCQHTVLGRLMSQSQNALDLSVFLRGVGDACSGGHLGLAHQLFAVRTLGLMEMLPAASLDDYLSGLLIGHEIQAGLAWRLAAGLAQAPLLLIGDSSLCGLYAQALSYCGVDDVSILSNTAPIGLWAIANCCEKKLLRDVCK
ncbi:2-dehydro-3-deoxygalactonokinase [Undibacterium seohonense]|uniref:2-dehydro-3-deoxygalactonokinase n=1 Tax=Undibacterium seohonense TaxID=1344950 RepID=A0ABR6X3N7_9BURK|nr:2-dehydro-3-deoxygalactonokinase [Undibacterium seohonense]MBC3806971.1 2-dehydro-3-deoxygalactonokinase [Undibacterium seohonense]